MPIELKKESIQVNTLLCHKKLEVVLEGDTIVPDTKPDILRVLQLDGNAVLGRSDIQAGRVIFTGKCDFSVLYRPDMESVSVKAMPISLPFNHIEEIARLDPAMPSQAMCEISHIEYELINSRKISVRAVVTIDFKAYDTVDLQVCQGAEGENIQCRQKSMNAYYITACQSLDLSVAEQLEIPSGKCAILEMLKVDAKVMCQDIKTINNKIVAKGSLGVCLLYLADDSDCTPSFMEYEIPFTEVLDVSGISDGEDCEFKLCVKDIYYDLDQNDEGELRIINCEISLIAMVKAVDSMKFDVIEDCYCPGFALSTQTAPAVVDEIITASQNQVSIRESCTLPEGYPPIMQVYNILSSAFLEEMVQEGTKVTFNGILDANILYFSTDDGAGVYSFSRQIPFSETVDCPDGPVTCDFTADITHADFSFVNAAEIDLRANINTKMILYRQNQMQLICDVTLSEAEAMDRPSIIIYFAQKGDTLWSVAKRYGTTIADILLANAMEEEVPLKPGMQLIIPR